MEMDMSKYNSDVVRGYFSLHGFYNPVDDDEILIGFIRSGPWEITRDGESTQKFSTKQALEVHIKSATGAQSFFVDAWIGRTFANVKQEHRDLIPDVVAELNRCGTSVTLQTVLEPRYHASANPLRMSVEVSELKYICRTYKELLRNIVETGNVRARATLKRLIQDQSEHKPRLFDENFFKSDEGKQFACDMSEFHTTSGKDSWLPALQQSLKGEDASFNPEIDYPPPTLPYEEESFLKRRFDAFNKKTQDKQNERNEAKRKRESAADPLKQPNCKKAKR